MSCHTSIRIGGKAEYFVIPYSQDALERALRILTEAGAPWRIIGAGTNILASDDDAFAVVSTRHLTKHEFNEYNVSVEVGMTIDRLLELMTACGYSGLEFASGLPGTLGGAIAMNAGAFGGEMSDLVESAVCLMPDMTIRKLKPSEMGFGYRSSVFRKSGITLLQAELRLVKGDTELIKERRRQILEWRLEKQPLQMPSAGSIFVRPVADFYVGAEIERLGLKGLRVGDAEVSLKHAGFIINRGSAKQRDVLLLIEKLRTAVFESSGHWLELELDVW